MSIPISRITRRCPLSGLVISYQRDLVHTCDAPCPSCDRAIIPNLQHASLFIAPCSNCGASTHVHARPRIEGKITVARDRGVTQHDGGGDDDDANDDEIAHNLPPLPRFPFSTATLTTSMCNNPYRHGWLPLLGLHNRALIDNLYGACRLFDYPPPAGSRRLDCATRGDPSPPSPPSPLTLSSLSSSFRFFFRSALSLRQVVCPRILFSSRRFKIKT